MDLSYTQIQITMLYVLYSLFSLAVGSLLNVIIYRLPQMLEADWQKECRLLLNLPKNDAPKINLFFPRSFCPSCKKTIPWWHNIPLLSYILLRGSCANCKQRIPIRYPMVELLSLLLSLAALIFFGLSIKLIGALIFIYFCLPMFFIDLKHQLLPDSLTLGLLWLGLLINSYNIFCPLEMSVLSTASAYLFLWLFIKIFYIFTGKIGMGNGDFKLFAAFGAWFGGFILPFILCFAAIIGAITGIIYLKFTKQGQDTPIPFGPFLCIGGILALFYGDDVLQFYLGFFGSPVI